MKLLENNIPLVKKVNNDYLNKKLGYDKTDIVDSQCRGLPDLPTEFFVAEDGNAVSKAIGYKVNDQYGVYNIEFGSTRYPISKDNMDSALRMAVEGRSIKTEAVADAEVNTVRGKLLETSQDLENAQEVFKFDIAKTVSAVNALAKYLGEVYSQNVKPSSDDYLPLKRKLEICYNELENTYEGFQSDLNNVKALMGKATSVLFPRK